MKVDGLNLFLVASLYKKQALDILTLTRAAQNNYNCFFPKMVAAAVLSRHMSKRRLSMQAQRINKCDFFLSLASEHIHIYVHKWCFGRLVHVLVVDKQRG